VPLVATYSPMYSRGGPEALIICVIYCRVYMMMQRYANEGKIITYQQANRGMVKELVSELLAALLAMGIKPLQVFEFIKTIAGPQGAQATKTTQLQDILVLNLTNKTKSFLNGMSVVQTATGRYKVHCAVTSGDSSSTSGQVLVRLRPN